MTRKEFFNAIITANINEELNEFAAAELEKMEAQRERAARFEISVQRATGLAGSLVKEGRLAKSEIKIPKVGKRVCYEVAAEENDD